MLQAIPRPCHSGTHRHLVDSPGLAEIQYALARPAGVDAIVVPTARSSAHLRFAMTTAVELGGMLVALCSRQANARKTIELGRTLRARVLVVDLESQRGWRPDFASSAMLSGGRFDSGTDLSRKRNIGLLLSRMAGWHRVIFLDDDLACAPADTFRLAAGLLHRYDAVGIVNVGFPDNSVLCHAHRLAGGAQDTFIGGGALALAPARSQSFFPEIYNEDWLFLTEHLRRRSVAAVGQIRQRSYDPFATPRRARIEEFGDSIAEGIYWLLGQGGDLEDATTAFWSEFLDHRRRLIHDTIASISALDPRAPRTARVVASLQAARKSNAVISPERCHKYLVAWRSDLGWWQNYITQLPSDLEPDKALDHLGLASQVLGRGTRWVHRRPVRRTP